MKTNRLFEDVFMDIDWSLYDDETAELPGLEKKIYSDMIGYTHTHHPKTTGELIAAIKEELANGNTDLNCIDTSAITDMSKLFDHIDGIRLSEEQQKALDVSEWDVSNVIDMSCMFCNCRNFNQNISGWDVRNVENMRFMFTCCTDFNQNISGWDVRNVENTSHMFWGCSNFNQDLSGWDVRKVKSMSNMFSVCTKLKENDLIPDWYWYK